MDQCAGASDCQGASKRENPEKTNKQTRTNVKLRWINSRCVSFDHKWPVKWTLLCILPSRVRLQSEGSEHVQF